MKPFGVCLFCSASVSLPETYVDLARRFGEGVATAGWRLVYGGGGNGLMGAAARAAWAGGAPVLGVMPQVLVTRERLALSIGENQIVDSMAERKLQMALASDAFVGLPGGIGTLDEVSEMITWNELGIHSKPMILVNEFGFWDPLLEFFRQGRQSNVFRADFDRHYTVVPTLAALFDTLREVARSATADTPGHQDPAGH